MQEQRETEELGKPHCCSGRRWARRAAAAALLLTGAFLIVWNAFPPRVYETRTTISRGEDGRFDESQNDRPLFVAQAGKIQSNNNLTSASSNTAGNSARLACRNVLLACRSDHVLAQRVAGDLLERLKSVPFLEQITYLPPGETPQQGAMAPDLFVSVELVSLEESGLIDHVVDASFLVRAGTSPVADNYSAVTNLTPPMVEFSWKAHLEHHSTTREVASSAAKYKLVSEDIAQQISNALAKQLDTFREKYGLLPELPAEFYPDYEPPPELPLEGYHPELVFSGHGLLLRNASAWKCRSEKPLADVLSHLRGRLEVAQFKGDIQHDALRMHNEVGKVVVLSEYADGQRLAFVERETPGETVFFVTYTRDYSGDDRDRAVAALFESAAPLETLLLFENSLTGPQRQQVLARFAEHPPATAEGWRAAASLYAPAKEPEQALEALKRAVALLPLSQPSSPVRSQLDALAKQLGHEKLVEELSAQPPDIDLLKELGFVEITANGETAPLEFGVGDAVNYCVQDGDEKWKLLSYTASLGDPGVNARYELALAQAADGTRSYSHGQTLREGNPIQQQLFVEGVGRLHFEFVKQPDQPRFTVTLQVQPVHADGSPLTPSPATDPGH